MVYLSVPDISCSLWLSNGIFNMPKIGLGYSSAVGWLQDMAHAWQVTSGRSTAPPEHHTLWALLKST